AHHHEFASYDDHPHPSLHQPHFHQRNKRGGNQQLVRNRIQQNSQGGDFFTRTRQVAVHHVRRGCRQQNQHAQHFEVDRQSPEIKIGLSGMQRDEQQWYIKYLLR